MNLEFLRFFYGTEKEYNDYIINLIALDDLEKEKLLENCFFYTIDTENGVYRLRLGQICISSNLQNELYTKIINSDKFKKFLNENYLSTTQTEGQQTIQSAIAINNDVSITKDLTVDGDFSSDNINIFKKKKKIKLFLIQKLVKLMQKNLLLKI